MRPPLQVIAPHIDDPVELLLACHEKVRKFSQLAVRLRDHLAKSVPPVQPDQQAREAAQSILRYFNVAAPLHHDDEEQDLFPALRALALPSLNGVMNALQAEHQSLARLWQALQPWLRDIAEGRAHPAPIEVDEFARAYPAHAQREDEEVYPSARLLPPEVLARISAAMVARRTSPTR